VKTSLVEMPAVFGCINSYLILPRNFENYPQQQQLIILSQELYHLKRSDHRFNLLRVFIKCLFWFNPLIYFADRYVEVDQELSCDLGVIHSAEQFGLRQYGETLINAISNNNSAYLVSQWNYRKLIKVRLQMLKNTGQKRWHSWVAAIFAMVSIWTTSSVIGGEQVDKVAKVTTAYPVDIVQPRYPREAVKNNIEGSVTIEFDLSKSGAVLSPRVVEAEPKGVFEDVALKAFSQWQFGKETKRNNLVYTMKFQLTKTPAKQISKQDIRALKKQLAEIEIAEKEVGDELARLKKRLKLSKEEQARLPHLETYHQQLLELKLAIRSDLS
jgi:TonB family protein